MNILILEDNAHRISWFKAALKGHKLTICVHTRAAKQALKKNSFEMIFLDHDLQGEPIAPESENSGSEVARYIVEHEIECACIIIHSENTIGSDVMAELLEHSHFIPYSRLKKMGMHEVIKLVEGDTP